MVEGVLRKGDLVGGDFLEGFHVEAALGSLDAVSEGRKGVVGEDGDFGLGEDGAVVVEFVDEMHGDACGFALGAEDGAVDVVAVHAASAEFGKEGGMGVDDAVAESAEGDWAEELHVACQDYQVDVVAGEGAGNGRVEVGRCRMSVAAEVKGGYGVVSCPLEGQGMGVVADNQTDASVEAALFAAVDYRLEGGAGVGGEDAEVERSRHGFNGGRRTCGPWLWWGPSGESCGCAW